MSVAKVEIAAPVECKAGRVYGEKNGKAWAGYAVCVVTDTGEEVEGLIFPKKAFTRDYEV